MTSITLIEEISMNAWPAAQTLLYDGWVLRFSGGYTRRANAVHPLYPSHLQLSEKIRACEALYRAKGLPVIFKLTTASQPPELEQALVERGYRSEAQTIVEQMDLAGWAAPPAPSCDLSAGLTARWQAAFTRLSGVKERDRAAHQHILESIVPEVCYASIPIADEIAGCGLAVLQEGYVGLFDIVVDPAQRRQGLGERLVRDLLGWAQHQGAHSAYLQVMSNNPPALRLYEKIGYREAYQYWYRVKS
jgi:N-acetylglutamate synthase